MLHAIWSGKARRLKIEGLVEPAPRWRDIFHSNEDLLTATVFERLAYLSDAVFRQLIAFMTGESGGTGFSLNEISFWPCLKGCPNRHWVEPDIIMLLEESLVVIEVKPPNGGGWQNLEQWKNEIRAAVGYKASLFHPAREKLLMERRRYCLCSNLCCAIQGDYPSVGMGAIRSGFGKFGCRNAAG